VSKPFCAYCGQLFSPDDPRERFCSDRCMRLFAAKFNLQEDEEFSLPEELSRLQLLINQNAGQNQHEPEADFYEQVFDQLRTILKWINANAIKAERKQVTEEQEIQIELEKQTMKLEKLLHRAAELKRENKLLRNKLSKLSDTDDKLAKMVLGIKEVSTLKDLKNAFRKKVKQVHPDRKNGDHDLFLSVSAAYEILQQKIES